MFRLTAVLCFCVLSSVCYALSKNSMNLVHEAHSNTADHYIFELMNIERLIPEKNSKRYVTMALSSGLNFEAEISDDTKEDFRKMVEPVAKACMEELGIDAEDLKEMKKKKEVDPCFVACVFKASGTINSNGKFDYEPSLDIAKEIVKDENVLDEMRKIGQACMKVNDEDVEDDCGRAKLLMECFRDNKNDWMSLIVIGCRRQRFRGGPERRRRREDLDAPRAESLGDETWERKKRRHFSTI